MSSRRVRILLVGILLLNLTADVVGIDWGLPYLWNTDEKIDVAASMLSRQSLDPQYFINPALHIYAVWAVTALAYWTHPDQAVMLSLHRIRPLTDPDNPARHFQFLAVRMARLLSAAFALVTLWLLFVTGRRHFDDSVALLAAGFLAVSMGFVDFAHFAEVESLLFLMTLWALYTLDDVIVWGRVRDYLIAGTTVGLSFSTKYTAFILAVPFLAAHFAGRGWRGGLSIRGFGLIAASTAMGVIAFVATTPYAVIHWRDFYDIMVYNWYTGAPFGSLIDIEHSWIPYLGILRNALGWPLFLLAFVGVGSAAAQLVRGVTVSPAARAYFIHGIWIVAFYGFYGVSSHRALRFIMPIVPSLMLITAAAVMDITRRLSQPGRRMVQVTVAMVFAYSIAYTAAAERMFLYDTRYTVGKWLQSHRLGPKEGIDYFMFEAYLPFVDDPRLPLHLRPFVVNPRLRAEKFHTEARQYLDRSSNLIVESQFYYQRFLDFPQRLVFPDRKAFYERLLAGADPSGYRPIRWFTYRNPWWLDPRPERIAPTMVVLMKPRR